MAAAVQFPATATISSLVFQKTPNKPRNTHFPLVCSPKTPIKLSNSIKTFSSSPSNSIRRDDNDHPPDALSISLPSFHPLKPYLISEWQPILKGWIFSALSVYCLSKLVPTVGKFSAIFYTFDSNRWIVEGLKLSALVLVRSAANYWQQAFLWEAALNSACRIRVYVFERVLKRDLWFFEGEVSTGDVAYRITAEAADVADTVYALLTTIVPNFLQLFAVATQMLVTSPVLSMISALVIPCISLVIALLGERLRTISRKAHLSVARLSAYLNEVLPSMLVIKANNATLCESVRFQRLAQDDLTELLKKKKMKALIPQITQAICIGSLLMFSTGSLVISGGSFDGSSMVSFITSLVLLIEPIQVIDKPDAVDLDSITGDVKFCDITFRYGDDMPLVLNGLNLHVKAGEVIAIVGPSGGGKSTLTKLLLRLYDPQGGCILLDNHDIQDIRLESLRRHIALVSQDITLFSGTVAENIGYRDLMSKIDMAQVEHAAKIANADEFIRTLSEGYETNIGQRGSLLSGGQKQRLAIARALYQNSSILILDEATSALDSRSELLVRQAVERLMDNHTVLVIAHSLETVRMADRVLLLDGGKLQEVTLSSVLSKSEEHGSLVSSGHII
ncbi:ABC transporter B family member 29, chloroplastic isoform X3 [Magnolia sinica]|uniref:ABC transporter B family member 29, chloroplastic isoform X3 n=1 Tax=Magnolia sinica TaxID=86752 RepID=UPI00265A6BEE|nr:ABC transporter B family member 29, chloroplastic isoform X3 [Magnolia sinica]